MLKTLENLDVATRRRVLSSVSCGLLPHTCAEEGRTEDEYLRSLEDGILEELGIPARVRFGPQEGPVLDRALGIVSAALTDSVLTRESRMKARERLGSWGGLPPDQYKVEFLDTFADHHDKFGIKKRYVEDIVQSPDDVDHLLSDSFRSIYNGAVSLYIKTFRYNTAFKTFTMLVETRRENATQIVSKAWRLYHSDIDLSGCRRPLDILKAFVDVYGITYRLADCEPTKFTLFQEVRFSEHHPSESFLHPVSPLGVPFEGSFILNRRDADVVEVSVAYAINLARYLPDLRNHGVKELKRWTGLGRRGQ